MQISSQALQKLSTLMAANPNEARAIIKLLSVEVLGAKTNGEYLLAANGTKLSATSHANLATGEKYWASVTLMKDGISQLTNPIKIPKMLQNNLHVRFAKEEFFALFEYSKPAEALKTKLLQELAHAVTKEEFAQLTPLALSLQNGVMSLPLFWNNTYAILQFKKRYNAKSKKSALDFYAAFEGLGPMSGVVEFDEEKTILSLHVAYEQTQLFLQKEAKEAPFFVSVVLMDRPEPLFNLEQTTSLLDTHI